MILFLEPYFESKPWAGDELSKIYDCKKDTGEAWIISGYKDKSSKISNGKFKGMTLRHLWRRYPELFGDFNEKVFPILVKLISAKSNLSVQVHPNDYYALKRHNSLGKFECWYVLNENKAKSFIIGVNVKNAIELKDIIDKNMLDTYLISKEIKKDDLVIIEPGTVHALTEGSFVLEVQESSDITYRLYDYNRLPKRELHIEDSLNVINYNNSKNVIHSMKNEDTFNNEHFNFYKLICKDKVKYVNKGFEMFYVISGAGKINGENIKCGDTFILTIDTDEIVFEGNLELIGILPKRKDETRLKMRDVAMITGAVGQDGYYLSKLLLEKGYEVHAIIQTKSQYMSSPLYEFEDNPCFFTNIGDMTDSSNVNRLLENIKPDEIYHLASQSHVDMSFELPEYTTEVNSLGTLRLVDAIKNSDIRTKLFNLSTPYLFNGNEYPQDEETPFDPKSPYAVSKLYAQMIVKSYRENYNLYLVNGICYNHTSKIKTSTFVSKKIIDAVKRVRKGENYILKLGNLNSTREWGIAKEYAYAMYLTLQEEKPDDYIIATSKAYSIRDFVTIAYKKIGINLTWVGEGLDEKGISNGKTYVEVDKEFLRPNDAKVLVGNPKKFNEKTGFYLTDNLDKLIDDMLGEK